MNEDQNLAARFAVQEVVQLTSTLLDSEDFDGWLSLFENAGEYCLEAYSTELRNMTVWWQADRATLAKQLKEVNQHVRDPAGRLHLVGPSSVTIEGERALARSSFAVFRSTPAGETSLYMVGRYDDVLRFTSGGWLYVRHKVISETRVLETLTHVPI